MSPGALGAFVTAHKKELLVGGAGVAVVGGLYARSKSTTASTAAAAASPGVSAPMPSASGTGYDSSASDVYNAIQPQIETTQTQLGQTQTMVQTLMDQLNAAAAAAGGSPTPPPVNVVPVNAAPDAPPPARVVYNAIYQGADGVINHPVSGAVQSAAYANGNLIYITKDGVQVQTADTPANRAGIPRDGGTIVGGY